MAQVITPEIANYRATLARLRDVTATMAGDEAQSDAQYYDALAAEQITLMDAAVEALAPLLLESYNASARQPMTADQAQELAAQALKAQGLIW